jgi:ATP-binding cassette subfamily B multidrug efflux pump
MRYGFGYFEEDHLEQSGEFHLWKRISGYLAPQWRGVAAAVFLSLIITATSLTLPYLVRIAVDSYIVNQDLKQQARLSGLSGLTLSFIGLIVAGFLANFFQVTILEWTGQNIMHRMRQHLFSHMLGLHLAFFNRNPIGKLVTRLTNDIQNMHEMFTSVIVTLFNDCIRIVGILAILFWMNYRLALVVCLLIPIIAINTYWFSSLAREAFRQIRTQLAKINAFLQEALAGITIIQLFMREEDTRRRFAALNREYLRKTMYQIKIFGIFMPMLEVLSAVAVGLIIWYGGGEIIRARMSLGELVAFLSYMRLFFQPLRELSQKYSIVQSAMASAERIFQLMDTRTALTPAATPLAPPRVHGSIEFRSVTFGYEPDHPVLHGFSLALRPGETVAIVGATGSGKTTIINLLERYYDPDQGAIRIDDNDIRHLDIGWLRQQVGLVMQDVFLLPDTVRKNILLDREMDDNALRTIIARAQLTELVANLPRGWDTKIGEGGMEVSAGQRQLLALARVLARDPRILVLDEATSNIDSETEILIERAIATTLANRTSIIIAHRLSTIRRAKRILVMDQGRIIEQGTHAELMGRHALYYHLQCLQQSDCREPA